MITIFLFGCGSPRPPETTPLAPAGAAVPIDASASNRQATESLVAELLKLNLGQQRTRFAGLSREQLNGLVEWGPCMYSSRAARRLAAQGEAARLYRRTAKDDPLAVARGLCLVAAIENVDERRGHLLDYLPPTGNVTTSHEECEYDGKPHRFDEGAFTRATVTGAELTDTFVLYETDACTPAATLGQHVCAGMGRARQVEITLAPGTDGRLYIARIASTTNCGE